MNEPIDRQVWDGVSRRLTAVEAMVPQPPQRGFNEDLVRVPARVRGEVPSARQARSARPSGRLAWSLLAVAATIILIGSAVVVVGSLLQPHLPGPLGRNGLLAYVSLTDESPYGSIVTVEPTGRDDGSCWRRRTPSRSRARCSGRWRVLLALFGMGGRLGVVGLDGSGQRTLGTLVSEGGLGGDQPIAWSPMARTSRPPSTPSRLTGRGRRRARRRARRGGRRRT